MGEWRVCRLGDKVEILNRKRIPLSRIERAKRQGPYRYFGAQGVIDHVDDYLFDGEYVLVAEDGENLRSRKQPVAALVSGRFWVNNHAHIVRANKDANNRFLLHAINCAALGGLISGAAQPKLTKANLERLQFKCPPRIVQERIAAVLERFDVLIAVNERRIQLLEDVARSLYHEWFVRFRFPGHERRDLVESQLGWIPEGWQATRLGDIVKLRYGKALPAGKRRPGPYPVVSSAGTVGNHEEVFVGGPGIVVGRKGNVGSVWWIDQDFFPIDTTYYIETEVPLGLVYWQLRNLAFIDSHAAVPGLSREQATSLLVLSTDASLAKGFDEIHRACFDSIAVLRNQNTQLAATRDLLLPRLVTGRLDISDVDLGDLVPTEAA